MTDKHPYVQTGGHLIQVINHLRKSFPATVNADMLKKLAIAPNSESYVISTIRFLGIIDEEGKKVEKVAGAFLKHNDTEFAQEFSEIVSSAYGELFLLHGDAAWTLDQDKLISFFRTNDKTGADLGRRQASTFQTLASIAGYLEVSKEKVANTPKPKVGKVAAIPKAKAHVPKVIQETKENNLGGVKGNRDFGLTVRIEINLPAGADQETYDKIFRSIKENLINVD